MTGQRNRRLTPALLIAGCLLIGVCLAPGALNGTPAAAAASSESDSPLADQGGNYHYRSELTGVKPDVHGLEVQVLEFADRLLLINHTGQTVTIYGYEGEPYARVLANGTAEENEHSPATYLNRSFYADYAAVPSYASAHAAPEWRVVDRAGQFEWHDHRIHWASPVPPERVRNATKRILVFNWQVPIAVGSERGAISGQLFWTPASSNASTAVIAIGAAIVVLGLLLVLFVRRRRRRGGARSSSAEEPGAPGPEAW